MGLTKKEEIIIYLLVKGHSEKQIKRILKLYQKP